MIRWDKISQKKNVQRFAVPGITEREYPQVGIT